uniref:RING-CH-type domain-containing protein n=1 Tax=Araucaria cunninghamii TaxID=56994 RepID=A0A0D6R237_ARACU
MERKVSSADGESKSRDKGEAVDIEKGVVGVSVGGDGNGTEKECRVCHMAVEKNQQDIELGCACKADLAVAHKHCAETWFRIKGDRTCEICGQTARNVVGMEDGEVVEQWNEGSATSSPATEERISWLGNRFLNFLLACVVFAFVISWLFRFSIPT